MNLTTAEEITTATTAEEINQIYIEVLGRDAGSTAIESYSTTTVDDIRSDLLDSDEHAWNQRRKGGEVSEATWESFWRSYSAKLELDGQAGHYEDANGNVVTPSTILISGALVVGAEEEAAAAAEDYTFVADSEGAFDISNAQTLFTAFQAQGLFQEEMVSRMTATSTYNMDKLIYAPMSRGQRFTDAGNDLTVEFGASSAGDLVIVPVGQNMYQDHYVDVTDRLQGLVPDGYVAYQDQGDQDGGRGLTQVIDDAFGTNLGDMYDQFMFNELKDSATSGALLYGSNQRDEGRQAAADLTGTQQDEIATSVNVGEIAALAIGTWYAGGYGGWAWGAAVAAGGTLALEGGRHISGSQAERDQQNWEDIAENVAIAAIGGAIGGGVQDGSISVVRGAAASAALGAVSGARDGDTTEDIGRNAAVSLLNAYSPYAGAAAATVNAKTVGGGTWEQAGITGATRAANAVVGDYYGGSTQANIQSAITVLGGYAGASLLQGESARRNARYSAVAGGIQQAFTPNRSARVSESDLDAIATLRAGGLLAGASEETINTTIDSQYGRGASERTTPNTGVLRGMQRDHRNFFGGLRGRSE